MKFRLNPLLTILLLVIASSTLLYWLQQRQLRHTSSNPASNAFVQAEIRGRLTYKSLRSGIQSIRVDNDSETFRFRPELTPEGNFFHVDTELGDSIIKQKDSLAIMVKTNVGSLTYTAAPAD